MRRGNVIPRFIRLAALLALASFGVHQFRYLLAYGPDSAAQLSAQGHDYLASAVPMLGALGLAALAATILCARFGGRLPAAAVAPRAIPYALAILTIYCSLELAEGALDPGHPAGLGALFAAGGWIAFPLALAFGLFAALAMRTLESVEAALAPQARRAHALPRAPRGRGIDAARHDLRPALSPLAFGPAIRPPPSVAPAH